MAPEVEALFHELADLTPAEREARLSHYDPALRAEVQSLLDFDIPSHDLTSHVVASAERVLAPRANRCGPYILRRVIARGGMGTVHLAERSDGELEQRVAVKLLRYGGAEPSFRDRFLRERQILAGLTHPGIARLLDAGHTDDDQPYLVMEYIDGQPIDAYAATVDVPRRLRLFLRVCDAVAYAHRKLVIHRDLKPSNILVDFAGEPKLLDFGIARILDAALDQTQTQERVLTPEYASPEQMRGSPQATTSDVYSLGAVLYKLLTGACAAAADASPPSRLNPDVPHDLDCIVRKALRQEPEERYVSVDAFADDIRALLESRPVRARSGNAWYRTRKFARRYWAPITAAALVFASLAGGLYIANRERVAAQHRFQQLRQLSRKIVDFDVAIRDLPGSAEARQRLVSASLEYLEGLGADAHGDLDLSQEIADAYWRVARVQGVPTELNLGQFAKAEISLRKADGFIDSVLHARPNSGAALLRSGLIAQDRMILAESEHRREDALAHARKAAGRFDQLTARSDISPAQIDAAATGYVNIALAHVNLHLYDDANRYARRAVDLARRESKFATRSAQALSLLANVLRCQGDLPAALDSIRQARAVADRSVYENETAAMNQRYGVFLREGLILGDDEGVSLDRPVEAIAAFEKAFDVAENIARQSPNDYATRSRVATSTRELGKILRHSDPARALAVLDHAIARLGEISGNLKARRDTASLLAISSYALRALGHAVESHQRLDKAVAILRETHDYPAERLGLDTEVYVVELARADDTPTPEAYETVLTRVLAAHPDVQNDLRDATGLAHLYERLSAAYRQAGAIGQADTIEARRAELWRSWQRKLPGNAFVGRQLR